MDEITLLLGNAVSSVNENKQFGFENARENVQNWSGNSAVNFKEYLTKASSVVDDMSRQPTNLKQVYQNYQSLVEACHNDLTSIIEK